MEEVVQNINDDICRWDQKPARTHYNKNKNHKIKCLEKFIDIDRSQYTYKESKAFTHFNFKKTNGRKYKYSCGGYGGKCYGCKNNDFSRV